MQMSLAKAGMYMAPRAGGVFLTLRGGVSHPKLTPAALLGPGVQSRVLALPAGSGTPSAEGELRVLLSASGNGFNLCFD